jgi:hypothetical protein
MSDIPESTTDTTGLRRRGSRTEENKAADTSDTSGYYSCNICFDTASEPVITLCGHLFCWPCLHQWLDTQRLRPLCPVCKAGCGKDKVIPIYGRGREAEDPRLKSIPRRPAGQRPEPTRPIYEPLWGTTPGLMGHHFGFSIGLGLWPSHMAWIQMRQPDAQATLPQQQRLLSRIFLMIGLLFFIAITFSE